MITRVTFPDHDEHRHSVPVANVQLPDGKSVSVYARKDGIEVHLHRAPGENVQFHGRSVGGGPIATQWIQFADMTAHLTIERYDQ